MAANYQDVIGSFDRGEMLSQNTENGRLSKRIFFSVILLSLNLLNYMDRFTVAGLLGDIQVFYDAMDSQLGLIQTVFVVFYMLAAPIFGYCGDRFNRKRIICVGLSIWLLAALFSSIGGYFWNFLFSRAVVGIGEAVYTTIAPSLIADMFSASIRSRVLMIYFTALPIGSGLGYIIGSSVAAWSGDWRWGLRATPLIGIALLVILIVFFEEPERGQADNAHYSVTNYREDVYSLSKIQTYVYITVGQTSAMFVTGSLSWWAPTMTEYAWGMLHWTGNVPSDVKADIGKTFGLLMCIGGLLGVAVGSLAARQWKQGIVFNPFAIFYGRSETQSVHSTWFDRYIFKLGPNQRSDPLVCAFGSLAAVPIMWLALFFFAKSMNAGWFFTFFSIVFLCVNISVTTEIILYITPPNRRATAVAIQTLIGHLLGDAASPYITGLISDLLKSATTAHTAAQLADHFYALRAAFYLPNIVLILSAVYYLKASKTVERDQEMCSLMMHDPPCILDTREFSDVR